MKMAYNMKRNFVLLFAVVCLFIFNTSCGLEVLYVIDSPYSQVQPHYSNEYDNRVFEFTTNENFELEGLMILGTNVYYCIYDNTSTLESEVYSISSIEDFSTIISSNSSYRYKQLYVNGNDDVVLIKYKGVNRKISIRLTDYLNIEDFSARVLVDGNYINGSASNSIPVRGISSRSSFNFGRPTVKIPVYEYNKNDSDAQITSSSSKGIYYVALFAVTEGQDANYKRSYSKPSYLGSVRINSNSPDN